MSNSIIEKFKNNETLNGFQMFQLLKDAEMLCSGDRLIHKLCDICDIQPIDIIKNIDFHFNQAKISSFSKTIIYKHKNSDLQIIENQIDFNSQYDMFEHTVIEG